MFCTATKKNIRYLALQGYKQIEKLDSQSSVSHGGWIGRLPPGGHTQAPSVTLASVGPQTEDRPKHRLRCCHENL